MSREYVVKAGYLLNFAKYTSWPEETFEDDDSPLVIGVLGPNPFADLLDRAAETKEVDHRPIAVRYFDKFHGDIHGCHLLYFSRQLPSNEMKDALKHIVDHPTLLLGDTRNFAENGGIIGFFIEENRVRFAINLTEMREHRLQISSKVLQLAETIKE